jgi:hypothetical protein
VHLADPLDQLRLRLADDRRDHHLGGLGRRCRGQVLHVAPHGERAVLRQRAHAGRLGTQRVPLNQELAAEQAFQGLPHVLQLVPQRGDVVPGVLLRLAFRLGRELELELAACGDLAFQLELVDLLPLGRVVPLVGELPAVPGREEGAGERRPQRRDDAEAQPLLLVGQHEQPGRCGGEDDGADQQYAPAERAGSGPVGGGSAGGHGTHRTGPL